MGNLRWRDQKGKTLLLSSSKFKSEGKSNTEPLHNLERKALLLERIKKMKSKQKP